MHAFLLGIVELENIWRGLRPMFNFTSSFRIGHAPHYFKLVSVHVLIRHGDRYPLYAIPKTKRPEIDCTLVSSR